MLRLVLKKFPAPFWAPLQKANCSAYTPFKKWPYLNAQNNSLEEPASSNASP